MPSKDDGGAAFPVRKEPLDSVNTGMSLRDYFAAHLAHGMIGSGVNAWPSIQVVAENAYKIADAMLAERKK